MTPEGQRLFTIEAASEYLRMIGAVGIGPKFVRAIVASGQVPALRMGRRIYVTRAGLDAWLAKAEKRALP
jgi:excisionase family DNA binding protein